MEETMEIHDLLQYQEQEKDFDSAWANCSGNACGSYEMRPLYGPRDPQTGRAPLKAMTVRNKGPKSIDFTIVWGDILGGCGISTPALIFPGEIRDVPTPHDNILGYCKIIAKFVD